MALTTVPPGVWVTAVVVIACALRGGAFGGAPTAFQAVTALIAGPSADAALPPVVLSRRSVVPRRVGTR